MGRLTAEKDALEEGPETGSEALRIMTFAVERKMRGERRSIRNGGHTRLDAGSLDLESSIRRAFGLRRLPNDGIKLMRCSGVLGCERRVDFHCVHDGWRVWLSESWTMMCEKETCEAGERSV